MKAKQAEMHEGQPALNRFRDAVRKILSVSKNDLPPDPFSKPKQKKKPEK